MQNQNIVIRILIITAVLALISGSLLAQNFSGGFGFFFPVGDTTTQNVSRLWMDTFETFPIFIFNSKTDFLMKWWVI